MLVFAVVLFSTLQVIVVKCTLTIIEPTIPQHENSHKSIVYMLGSMTPYHVPSETSSTTNSCMATKAIILMRHGPKYPKKEVMDKIKELEQFQIKLKTLYQNGKELDSLPAENKRIIADILIWKNLTFNEEPKAITKLGSSTAKDLGKRWNAKLNGLGTEIEKTDIQYQSVPENRCMDSGKIFLHGFLENNKNNINANEIPIQFPKYSDNRIKLNKVSKQLLKVAVAHNKLDDAENVYFKNICSKTNCPVLDKIRVLLFPNNIANHLEHRETITIDLMKTMYSACTNSYGYIYSKDVRGHAWCLVFDYQDLETFEGLHDIQYYYKNGYHDEKMANVGHPMMKYMLEFLSDEKSKKFELFSAHTANCLSMITGFRLFQDTDKLTVDDMTTNNKFKNRKWRVSFTANYTCNIAVAVYNCTEPNSQKASIYFNEIPLKMKIVETGETCTQCPIEDVKKLIENLIKS